MKNDILVLFDTSNISQTFDYCLLLNWSHHNKSVLLKPQNVDNFFLFFPLGKVMLLTLLDRF